MTTTQKKEELKYTAVVTMRTEDGDDSVTSPSFLYTFDKSTGYTVLDSFRDIAEVWEEVANSISSTDHLAVLFDNTRGMQQYWSLRDLIHYPDRGPDTPIVTNIGITKVKVTTQITVVGLQDTGIDYWNDSTDNASRVSNMTLDI